MNDTNPPDHPPAHPPFRPLDPDDVREAEVRRRVHEAHAAGQRVGWGAALDYLITLLVRMKEQGRNDAAQTPSDE